MNEPASTDGTRTSAPRLPEYPAEAPRPEPAPDETQAGSGAVPSFLAADESRSGTRFRIVKAHAKGGLGIVHLARDTELNRDVALKEIQEHHADDAGSRGRFLFEGEITGGLEHPGIVPVYGLGTYDNGRPYYAMRFVRGESLKEAIEKFHAAKLPYDSLEFRALLNRFVAVCNAIGYAHARGILHRDIKPANVMLGAYGETLVVDWGLAKALKAKKTEPEASAKEQQPKAFADASGSDETPLIPLSGSQYEETSAGTAHGTPAFMSPEQAAGEVESLTASTDVYALGGTLYALAAGRTAHEGVGSQKEIFERIRTGTFAPPTGIRSDLPAPLNAIVMKAMALAPADRYPQAMDLTRDVERYLADEPISAHRESATARARRWMRKHPGPVAGLAAAVLVGVVGLMAGLYFVNAEKDRTELARQAEAQRAEGERLAKVEAQSARRAEAERAEGERRAKVEAQNARELTQKRLVQIEKGNEVLSAIFADLDIRRVRQGNKPLEAVLAERLVKAAGQIEGEAVGDPLRVAQLQERLGTSIWSLGFAAEAVPLFERARATRRLNLGPDHPDTLFVTNNLALAYADAGQIARALPLLEESFELAEAKLGPDHPETLTGMANLAAGYNAAGQVARALPLMEAALRLRTAKLGPDHPETLNSLNNLATGYDAAGQTDRALPLFEEAYRLTKLKLGPDHPHTLISLSNLAAGYHAAGQPARALPLLEEALRLRAAKLGPEHPNTLLSTVNLAAAYHSAGQLARALPLYEEAVRLMKAKLGPDHPNTLESINYLATGYVADGQFARATPLFQEYVQGKRKTLAGNPPQWSGLLATVSSELIGAREYVTSEKYLRECLSIRERIQPDLWITSNTRSMLGGALLGQKKYAEAEPLLVEGYEGMKAREKTISPQAATRIPEALDRLIELYTAIEKPDEAKKWRAERAKYPELLPMPREKT